MNTYVILACMIAVVAAKPFDGSVDLTQDTSGKYNLNYETPDATRTERRSKDGEVVGSYTYKDTDGVQRTTNYVADQAGFRAEGASIPKSVQDTPEVAAARSAHLAEVHKVRTARHAHDYEHEHEHEHHVLANHAEHEHVKAEHFAAHEHVLDHLADAYHKAEHDEHDHHDHHEHDHHEHDHHEHDHHDHEHELHKLENHAEHEHVKAEHFAAHDHAREHLADAYHKIEHHH